MKTLSILLALVAGCPATTSRTVSTLAVAQAATAAPPYVSMAVWQGPQTTANYGLEYISSLMIEDVAVNGVTLPEGTVVELWTPPIAVTGIASRKVGECKIMSNDYPVVVGGRCIMGVDMPITQEIARTGNYATTFYLPAYNASMGYGWSWKSCH